LLMQQQTARTDAPDAHAAIDRATSVGFILLLDFNNDAGITRVIGTVADSAGGVVGRKEVRGNPITVDMLESLAIQMGIGLLDDLRATQEKPIVPRLSLARTPETVGLNGRVTTTVTLKECDGTLIPNKPVVLLHWPVGRPRTSAPERLTGMTDGNGTASFPIAVGTSPGAGILEAVYERRGQRWATETQFYRAEPEGDLRLSSSKGGLKPGESAEACVKLFRFAAPVAGAAVQLSALGGTLSATSVTTGADGSACVTFTTDPNTGPTLANLRADYEGTLPGGSAPVRLAAGIQFPVDGGVKVNANAELPVVQSEGASTVSADVTFGGLASAGVPVNFSVTGGGTLSVVSGGTNDAGRASVLYVAPASGSGTATITATATVNGQLYVSSAPIDYVTSLSKMIVKVKSGLPDNYTFTSTVANFHARSGWDRDDPYRANITQECAVMLLPGVTYDCNKTNSDTTRQLAQPDLVVSPPVSLNAQVSGAAAQWRLFEPVENVLAWDVTASGGGGSINVIESTGSYSGAGGTVYVQLTFGRAGELKIEANPAWGQGSAQVNIVDMVALRQLLRYCFDNSCPNTALSVTRQISGPGTLLLRMGAGAGGSEKPSGSGSGRLFTLTFTPH
ncbi:MAG: Ig-like domain-containing protein, partial [Armatimonadetes bacterium]|nr:Ig-like domain-containing protein [Armatimonadota bacterium]